MRAIALRIAAAAWICAAGPARAVEPARSPAVYPSQQIALRFSHRQHLEHGAECARCHAEALRSQSAGDRLVPAEARCAECHPIQAAREGKAVSPPSGCGDCHPGFDLTVHRAPEGDLFPRAALRFSHARHQALGAACARCHGGVDKVDLATRDQLPAMATCLSCHDGKQAPGKCALCHLTKLGAKGAALETELPGGTLKPGRGDPLGLDHGPRFELTHGLTALGKRETCLACHVEKSCSKCHDGTAKPKSAHPGNWMAGHPVPARMDEPHCGSCHRRQTFCIACHERVGIGADAAASFSQPGVRIHPSTAIWVGNGPGSHGVQAARNISQCASCHREERCLQCHSAAAGRRVHPPGFAKVCGSLLRKNAQACKKCHTVSASDPNIAKCR